jgi:hypothetical protein
MPNFLLPCGFGPFLGMAGRYKQPVQYRRESAQKSWALGNHSSLGDYMYEIQHINEEEKVLISRTREKSAVVDSAEPKQ